MNDQKSPHILNASSNLLGLCFVVLTSLKVLKLSDHTTIDEITAGTTVLFMLSCILSFMSIRNSFNRSDLLENRRYPFPFRAGVLLLTILLFSFNIIA